MSRHGGHQVRAERTSMPAGSRAGSALLVLLAAIGCSSGASVWHDAGTEASVEPSDAAPRPDIGPDGSESGDATGPSFDAYVADLGGRDIGLDADVGVVADASAACGGTSCGTFGTCVEGLGGPRCECAEGHVGPACDACARGWIADAAGRCQNVALCDGSNPCFGHGTGCRFSDAIGGDACDCEAGYIGDLCGSCAFEYLRAADGRCLLAASCTDGPCAAHGACVEDPDVRCVCEAGWGEPRCDACAPGFHADADACVPDVPCEATSCDFHGACSAASGLPTCSCDFGYVGAGCEACDVTHRTLPNGVCVLRRTCAELNPCRLTSQCEDASGALRCTCGDAYSGEACESCAAGHHEDGAGSCVADTACVDDTCDRRGNCSLLGGVPRCACFAGYTGAHCESCEPGTLALEDVCVACQPVLAPFDDLYGDVQPAVCAVAGVADIPVRYRGISMHDAARGQSPGIGVCDATDGPFASDWLRLEMAGGFPPYWVFDHAVRTVRFDVAGIGNAGTLEITADGFVYVVALASDVSQTVEMTFSAPVTTLVFDAHAPWFVLGVDELSYAAAACDGF